MRRAEVILVQNEETRNWIPARLRDKAVLAPNAVLDTPPPQRLNRGDRPPTALFAGELLPLKGIALVIRAIARTPDWRLVICGTGRDERRLRETARRLGVQGRVRFLGQQPRKEVLRLMSEEADVLLFPSLHDEGPMVVAEALTVGLPVVCLDRGGAQGFGGIAVRAGNVRETSDRLARALMSAPAQAPSARFSFEAACERVAAVLRSRGLLADGSDTGSE
jgi:glycosyltransferase involved in cell wall biosynthesis